jgi:hypothetical protein
MSLPGFSALINAWWFLLLVPLIIFYFLKLQRPRMEIPSLALWRQVINDQRVNSPFQKFKRNLLLLLQVLLLCALILGAMQPYLSRGTEQAQYLPVLIDNSASMAALDGPGGKSRLDEAKEKVSKLIDDHVMLGIMPRTMPERLRTIGYNARDLDGISGMNGIGACGKGGADFSNQGFPAKARRRKGRRSKNPDNLAGFLRLEGFEDLGDQGPDILNLLIGICFLRRSSRSTKYNQRHI